MAITLVDTGSAEQSGQREPRHALSLPVLGRCDLLQQFFLGGLGMSLDGSQMIQRYVGGHLVEQAGRSSVLQASMLSQQLHEHVLHRFLGQGAIAQ